MNTRQVVVLILLLGGLWLVWPRPEGKRPDVGPKVEPVKPLVKPWFPRRPCPPNRPCPGEDAAERLAFPPVGAITLGGPVGPGGVEVACDLPVELRKKNIGSHVDGAGMCVATSIMHAARYQSVPELWNLQEQAAKMPGGAYPAKVDMYFAKFAPGVSFLQYEGHETTILELALRTGRLPSVTYDGRDVRYGGARIAHMVNAVALTETQAAILDNNFVSPPNEILWLSRQEFLSRWTGGRSGWAVILLSESPPPPPRSK